MLNQISTPSMISEATYLHGEVTFTASAQIFGTIEGTIYQQCHEPLHIGKTGWVCGSIFSQGTVFIEGRVEGDIYSTTRIQLHSTAQVTGNLRAPTIEITGGALFQGESKMESSQEGFPTRQLKLVGSIS